MKPKLTLKNVLLSWMKLAALVAIISGTSWLVINLAIKPILEGAGG